MRSQAEPGNEKKSEIPASETTGPNSEIAFMLTLASTPLTSLAHPRILVLGDLILDKYTFGNAERVSPEAPVVILQVDSKEVRLGGGASVAMLLRRLGAEVTLSQALSATIRTERHCARCCATSKSTAGSCWSMHSAPRPRKSESSAARPIATATRSSASITSPASRSMPPWKKS